MEREEAIEHADAGGQHDDNVLRGDDALVAQRREEGRGQRERAAVEAALAKIKPVG